MDYRLKYPDDEPGHELDENARVWWAYNDEANAYDTDWINALADSLDILLVFAGLFSAVLTTFVAQTSQSLSVQSPSANDLWVNGLWFTSLTISLCVALFAVLSKQWLRQYMSIITGTAREQALIRQFRFDGLKTWRIQGIVGILPILLHLSLILFLVGLIVFLHPLNIVMAWVSGSITLAAIALYAGANLLPLLVIQCPYRTTFTDILHITFAYLRSWKLYFRCAYHLNHGATGCTNLLTAAMLHMKHPIKT
ncbi:hypothetical protein C8R45DRAFT_844209 [Mycena sanguinolenta]|nr:hypothetical protein C8R45DRAFT_844209 [Mycena sanguinolenta]